MDLLRFDTIGSFREAVSGFLVQRETEHGVFLGVLDTAATIPPTAYAAAVIEEDRVIAAAFRLDTRLLLSRCDTLDAVQLIAQHEDVSAVSHALGPPDVVRSFVATSGRGVDQELPQGVYECREVVVPERPAPGECRLATMDDVDPLTEWRIHLQEEVFGEMLPRAEARARVTGHITAGAMHVWEDANAIVSSAGVAGPTPHGARVGPVYTPPATRNRGYATSLVADLTQSLLDGGRSFAFLHTDLANPTSNAIYQRIGYRRVADFLMVKLASA